MFLQVLILFIYIYIYGWFILACVVYSQSSRCPVLDGHVTPRHRWHHGASEHGTKPLWFWKLAFWQRSGGSTTCHPPQKMGWEHGKSLIRRYKSSPIRSYNSWGFTRFWIQEISNTTHWTHPLTWVSNSSIATYWTGSVGKVPPQFLMESTACHFSGEWVGNMVNLQ